VVSKHALCVVRSLRVVDVAAADADCVSDFARSVRRVDVVRDTPVIVNSDDYRQTDDVLPGRAHFFAPVCFGFVPAERGILQPATLQRFGS
jgi:hypothetical protein